MHNSPTALLVLYPYQPYIPTVPIQPHCTPSSPTALVLGWPDHRPCLRLWTGDCSRELHTSYCNVIYSSLIYSIVMYSNLLCCVV